METNSNLHMVDNLDKRTRVFEDMGNHVQDKWGNHVQDKCLLLFHFWCKESFSEEVSLIDFIGKL